MTTNKIINIGINYETIYRNVKYPRLEFKTGSLILILPKKYKNEEKLIRKHETWILRKKSFILEALKNSENKKLIMNVNQKEFEKLVKSKIEELLKEEKEKISKIFFKKMKSKWASCSSKGNITINSFLKYLPKNLIEYVLYHELIHLKEKKHNENFWRLISRKYTNYEEMEKDLFIYWFLIQKQVLKQSLL